MLPKKYQLDANQLLDVLKNGAPHREVYRGQDGSWFVTYRGGEADPSAVRALVTNGTIQSVYSNCPQDSYHIGKTYDVDRTIAARRELGKSAPNYFVGDN